MTRRTSQQIVVRAKFADGSERDVTDLARYSSTDETIAKVERDRTGHADQAR